MLSWPGKSDETAEHYSSSGAPLHIEMTQTLDDLDDDALVTIFAALTIPDIQAFRQASIIFARIFTHGSKLNRGLSTTMVCVTAIHRLAQCIQDSYRPETYTIS